MAITSNKSFLDWGEVFSDPVLATAILDRLLHYLTTLNTPHLRWVQVSKGRATGSRKSVGQGCKAEPAGPPPARRRWKPSPDNRQRT